MTKTLYLQYLYDIELRLCAVLLCTEDLLVLGKTHLNKNVACIVK